MSVTEFFARLFAELKPLLISAAAVVAATIVAVVIMFLRGRSAWLKSKKFALPSLFFGLNGWGVVRLACAWLKFLLPIVYIVSCREPVLVQYLTFVIPALILAFMSGGIGKIFGSLIYLVIETAGIFSVGAICGYIIATQADKMFWLVYAAVGIFIILFAAYIFIQDIEHISALRHIDANKTWRESEDEA